LGEGCAVPECWVKEVGESVDQSRRRCERSYDVGLRSE